MDGTRKLRVTADSSEVGDSTPQKKWIVLIADDEKEVHNVTKMVLRNFLFQNHVLEFISAYSAAEAIETIKNNPLVALVLLDVVMENDRAGFEVVEYIRNTVKNKAMRIILRTGQPGYAPQRNVIEEYDINDYKEKTELTSEKLYTSVMASLRAYEDIITITKGKHGLESIIKTTGKLFKAGKNLEKLFAAILEQLNALLQAEGSLISMNRSLIALHVQEQFNIVAASTEYRQYINTPLDKLPAPDVLKKIKIALETKKTYYYEFEYVGYFALDSGHESVLYLKCVHKLEPLDQDLLEVFSSNITLAFSNISLTHDIVDTQKEILFTIGDVVETRSKETANHTKRVMEYSRIIAQELGISDDDLELLQNASPMHDLGKIGIPDSILAKPGALTPEEFAVIQNHTIIGYEILCKSQRPILKAAATISLEHHERWDGKGYPHGISGENINLFARITSVADVFDALSHKRVYKQSWTLEDAKQYILDNRGTFFDPAIVAVFEKVYEDICQIKNLYSD